VGAYRDTVWTTRNNLLKREEIERPPPAGNPAMIAIMRPSQVASYPSTGGTSANSHPQASQYGASAFVIERQRRHCFLILRFLAIAQVRGRPQTYYRRYYGDYVLLRPIPCSEEQAQAQP
jgi:hypothetical protein